MVYCKIPILAFLLVICLSFMSVKPAFSQTYSILKGDEPKIMAILYHDSNPRALLHYKSQNFHVVNRMKVDEEWMVEEIRRKSILFRRTSNQCFAEIYLNSPKTAHRYWDWSFFGHPISLWEALELLSYGFGYQAVMHFQAGGTVVPGNHSSRIRTMLRKILPKYHKFSIMGPVFMVMPDEPGGEEYEKIIERIRKFRVEGLLLRYPGLNKTGVLVSRGDDIQFVLRKISLGSGVVIRFPYGLHFPVYAAFRNIPFAQILSKIIYLNQCTLIEREDCIEISPQTKQVLKYNDNAYPKIEILPFEPQAGSGPKPPPIMPEHMFNYPIIRQNQGL